MANEEQLKLLKAGVEGWNKWREENLLSKIYIDLDGASLKGFDLRKAKLLDAHLYDADLSGTNLVESNLDSASLVRANLVGANLNGANLNRVDFSASDLSEATINGANLRDSKIRDAKLINTKLIKAYLFRANLTGSNLSGADLSYANLSYADLSSANLSSANLFEADLLGANLIEADLNGANLNKAKLVSAKLCEANLSRANLIEADLGGANLTEANLAEADLTCANLFHSNLAGANISNAIISKSNVYWANVWDLVGEFKEQKELIITPRGESAITVDDIKVAQFVYLILNNKEIRDVINTLTSKTVLILGRFAPPERKAILDGLRNKLREYDLLPIVFDFDRPVDKDFTETIKTLASISYFVIADITNPKSSPLELQATVPDYQIPFVPIIQEGEFPFAMMANLQTKYNWVLDTISYDSIDTLIEILKPHIIDPAIKMRDKLRIIKAKEPTIISGRELKEKGKKAVKSKRGKP